MSSIRWSALFLSVVTPFACAPHYDVGDADSGVGGSSATGGSDGSGGDGVGGSSTTGGTGNASSGGSSTTGGSGGSGGSGGTSTTGGTGGTGEGGSDPTGGTGGSSVGTGGSFTAGSGGTGMEPAPACGAPYELEYDDLPSPEMAWEKMSRFLFGTVREPPSELPEETTPEWLVQILGQALDQSRAMSALGGHALTPFMQGFFREAVEPPTSDTPANLWARRMVGDGSRLGIFFEGDQTSNPPFGLFGSVATAIDGLTARGGFLNSRLFCREIPTHPIVIEPVEVGPGQTRREALVANTADPTCAGCHYALDPLAYPLEVLAPGTQEYRTTENGRLIDTSGSFQAEREAFEFEDLESLGSQLSVSCEVARCLAVQLYNHAAPEDSAAYTEAELERALHAFAAEDAPEAERFRFQALLEAIVTSPTFLR